MKIGDIINGLIYILLIICLVLWYVFPNIFPNIDIKLVLIVLISVLLASEVTVIPAIKKIESKITVFEDNEIIRKEQLTDAITEVLSSRKDIKTLRIYALSTKKIVQFINGSLNCNVDECKLFIRGLYDERYDKKFGSEVEGIIEEWDDLRKGGRIEKLEICYYDFFPSEYNIIIDDEILIIGNYMFSKNDRAHVKINGVLIVSNARLTGKKVIDMYIKRFDESYKYFMGNGGSKIRKEAK